MRFKEISAFCDRFPGQSLGLVEFVIGISDAGLRERPDRLGVALVLLGKICGSRDFELHAIGKQRPVV